LQHVADSTYVAIVTVAVAAYVAVKWALLIGSCLGVGV